MFRIRHMANQQILMLLLVICLWTGCTAQLNKFKGSRQRAGSSKFSLNPLKPLMNLMRQDPMKAAAQRHHPKYLPPPPNMYQQMTTPSRTTSYGIHPYRPYPSHTTRVLPPTTVSLVPPLSSAASSMMLSALVNDHNHHHHHHQHHSHYRPQSSDLQIKAVRIPSKSHRRPASVDSFNIADSVVRQLLDMQPQQQQTEQNYPSVLVIEDPDVASSSNSEIFGDSLQQHQKVLVAPPVHAELASDTSDMSTGSSSNPEVFVIVSKNKNKNAYYTEDKKSEVLSTSSSSPKMKKYKITSAYDENGGRQVWIIKR